VVVLDAMMPGLDGFDTCRRCAACRLREHPVLMLTGSTTSLDHRAYQAGPPILRQVHQWSLLAGRLRYCCALAHAARAERSKAKLARGRTWRAWAASTGGAQGASWLSPRACACSARPTTTRPRLRMLRMAPDDERALLRLLHEVLQPRVGVRRPTCR
jgi:CheY-like chemotaxis protein